MGDSHGDAGLYEADSMIPEEHGCNHTADCMGVRVEE